MNLSQRLFSCTTEDVFPYDKASFLMTKAVFSHNKICFSLWQHCFLSCQKSSSWVTKFKHMYGYGLLKVILVGDRKLNIVSLEFGLTSIGTYPCIGFHDMIHTATSNIHSFILDFTPTQTFPSHCQFFVHIYAIIDIVWLFRKVFETA